MQKNYLPLQMQPEVMLVIKQLLASTLQVAFWDELSWAAVWIYLATNDSTYLDKAESYVANWGKEQQTNYYFI